MTTRRKQLTEDIKAGIREAAAALFAEKGYPSVTMREIAKAAGCSHTAIYLHYKNKEDLLQQIAIPPLEELERRMLAQLDNPAAEPMRALAAVCREYAVFCLTKASLQTVLIASGSVRVDEEHPELEVNRIRNRLFGHMLNALGRVLDERKEGGAQAVGPVGSEEALNQARILFYYVQGFVSTYTYHTEPIEDLLERTLPIFEGGIKTIVTGLRCS
ncbi:TetR/AcrR family transcriptional regulator [Paenibacillus oenotherae]|uniref:TetR/AcrR family transcriptional regulator n=1 Tax=Paenibacillus oenotherae TaxID=1435645 RepID=A0ABS7D3F6_9BACL|nr:TetR/AcrR family transcriptional regulator [Paenibacillus oenotherae]MBW7474373.1 TetR/AcrR family transcriptional regulator [Paenibacillus oenotherae]